MGLYNYFDDTNKVVNTELNVTYSMSMSTMQVTGWHKHPGLFYDQWFYETYSIPYYNCCRYATKSYEYVGMSYNAAIGCRDAMIAKYQREYSIPYVYTEIEAGSGKEITVLSSETVIKTGASVACTHDAGSMWKVVVSVNETDEKPVQNKPSDITTLFIEENNRDYD